MGGTFSLPRSSGRVLTGLQPFDYQYTWNNSTDNLIIADPTISILNSYKGGAYQEATSVVTATSA